VIFIKGFPFIYDFWDEKKKTMVIWLSFGMTEKERYGHVFYL
jgi:hypothetical protein